MKVVMFYHSLISDWNHGNAHFLRGIASELIRRGHEVRIYEPAESWSLKNLIAEHGRAPVSAFHSAYPSLRSIRYRRLDAKRALRGADLVIVHEWNHPDLVRAVGEERPTGSVALFHDTHHRVVSAPEEIAQGNLSNYDGVLAYGRVLKDLYLARELARKSWTWHEAADTEVFRPVTAEKPRGDLVWIGNWGDGERSAELEEFLVEPARRLGLKASVYGVRYPKNALNRLARAGIQFCGWLPNFLVPRVFGNFKVTVHIPRGPYVSRLRGIPTIRPFEALACGIPLVCSPWNDDERMFTPGADYLVAKSGDEMTAHLRRILTDKQEARNLAKHGMRTIRQRHTCAHRVNELLDIYQEAKGIG